MADYIIFYLMGCVCSAMLWRLVNDWYDTEWKTQWKLFVLCFLSWIMVPVFMIALIVRGIKDCREERERDRKKKEFEYRRNWGYQTPESRDKKNNRKNVRMKSHSK